jgi:hypothetical protein
MAGFEVITYGRFWVTTKDRRIMLRQRSTACLLQQVKNLAVNRYR